MAKTQIQNFREAARRLQADESEESFDKALGQIARHKPKSERQKDEKIPAKPAHKAK